MNTIFEIASNIQTPLAALSFISAVIAFIVFILLKQKKKQIEIINSASERDRAELVERSLETYHIKNDNLTRQQKYDLMMAVLRGRVQRFRTGALVALAGFLILLISVVVIAVFDNTSNDMSHFELPVPENESQIQSAKLLDWWQSNNQKLFREKGKLNSAKYLTIWSQHFQRGRVIYNHVDGWAIVANGTTRSFKKIKTLDALITSGPGNSTIEREVLNDHLSDYPEVTKGKIVELIEQRELLGGVGTLFIRDYLYKELGWPIGGEYLEREVIFGEADDYFVFIGLQNRPGDSQTECTMWFDEFHGNYTKQTNLEMPK